MLEIWIAYYAGQFVRAGQRALHVVGAAEERTWRGYLEHNWGRIVFRILSSAAVLQWVIFPLGWVTIPPVAFMVGFSYEAIAEDLLNRIKDKSLTGRKPNDTNGVT